MSRFLRKDWEAGLFYGNFVEKHIKKLKISKKM
jgi:hypothetical protein